MRQFVPWRWRLALMAIILAVAPQTLFACATCFGASDSDLAKGMNWGIFSLLVVVAVVLSGIASFFIYIGKRSAAFEARTPGRTPENSEGT